MKTAKQKIVVLLALLMVLGSCQKFDELELNPNVASEDKPVPPSYLLGRITFEIYQGGGVVDNRPGRIFEGPWREVMRWNQFMVSNDTYYGGDNAYIWTNTATTYNILKNVIKMEEQAFKTLKVETNAYSALAKFFRAYLFVWMTQRIGDLPMTEAGKGLENLSPKFNTQKEVYAQSLMWLEEANNDLALLIPNTTTTTASIIEGDIYYGNNLKKWQQVVNTFKLRVLISLSKRAEDTPDLGIKEKFAEMLNNPAKYPLMNGNGDNLSFKYNQLYNQYPLTPTSFYNDRTNISKTYLDITTALQDPRTFVVATPAPAQLAAGKKVSDFTAYVGSDIGKVLPELSAESAAGKYSYTNFIRYYSSFIGPENYTIIGYPEMCFNIAEGLNRGWATGNAADYYSKGINASITSYGIANGTTLTVADVRGKTIGTVTVSVTDFLAQPSVVYSADNATALKQILEQKYVAFFQNSGWEAFYNQRRTGVPEFSTGPGINGTGKIPKRWQYPIEEANFNTENYNAAIQSQFGGTDDLYKDLWIVK